MQETKNLAPLFSTTCFLICILGLGQGLGIGQGLGFGASDADSTRKEIPGLFEIRGGVSAAWTPMEPSIKDEMRRLRTGVNFSAEYIFPIYSHLHISSGFGLDAYGQNRVKNSRKSENAVFDSAYPPPSTPNHLSIPLKLRWHVDQGWNLLVFEFGPEWSRVLNWDTERKNPGNENLNNSDWGLALRSGYGKTLEGNYIVFSAEYYHGLQQVNAFKKSAMENRAIRINIAYLFGINKNAAPDLRRYE